MMATTQFRFEEIPASDGLDSIQVYWRDVGEGQGHVTITCYGCAWTAYFPGMSGKTIRQFFASCDVDYTPRNIQYTHPPTEVPTE